MLPRGLAALRVTEANFAVLRLVNGASLSPQQSVEVARALIL
jgi:hypothetical protein